MAFAGYTSDSIPTFVQEAKASVSSKMSYSYGLSTCKVAQKDTTRWDMTCSSSATPSALSFIIQSADKAPYDVATSFYLIANNAPAKQASGEGLLSYLMINTDPKS